MSPKNAANTYIMQLMIFVTPSVTRFKSEETQLFCLRVMVGVIILYDHVHPVGAFAIMATIDVSVCVCVWVCVCACVWV